MAGVGGQSGSITIASDGAYGALAGKAVAVEPATGFTFDTSLGFRQRQGLSAHGSVALPPVAGVCLWG